MSRSRFIAGTADAATRVGAVNGDALQLVISESVWQRLQDHLFPGDGEEHAAVVAAGLVRTQRGARLLARELFLARDGVDFVAARRAHRRLTPTFVNKMIRHCRDEGLTYLAIHNHGPGDAVSFSSIDLASHERGYPALLDIARGQAVGALVLATDAVAGDIWFPNGARHPIGETVVLGRNRRRLYPARSAAPAESSAIDDRQVRIYGDAGQALLSRLKVGVIGAGGVGLPIVSSMARLGVGHLVVIDPDRVELTNLPRLPEGTRRDAMSMLTAPGRPRWAQRLGGRLSTPKVALARRVARRARRDITIDALRADVSDASAAAMLIDCDYLFLAADSHVARAVFNAMVFGFLVPGVQIGSKVVVDGGGAVGDIFSVIRPVGPEAGCLWCNGLISPARLTEELLPTAVREAQRYVPIDDAPAPSVITLNALGIAQAADHFLLAVTGLLRRSETHGDYRRFEARSERLWTEQPRRDAGCPECGLQAHSLRGRGDETRLPRRQR